MTRADSFNASLHNAPTREGHPVRERPGHHPPHADWFKEIRPARWIPVLRDSARGENGRAGTISDSSAACAFLERHTPEPALYPTDPCEYGRAVWYEEYADSELGSRKGLGLFRALIFPTFPDNLCIGHQIIKQPFDLNGA